MCSDVDQVATTKTALACNAYWIHLCGEAVMFGSRMRFLSNYQPTTHNPQHQFKTTAKWIGSTGKNLMYHKFYQFFKKLAYTRTHIYNTVTNLTKGKCIYTIFFSHSIRGHSIRHNPIHFVFHFEFATLCLDHTEIVLYKRSIRSEKWIALLFWLNDGEILRPPAAQQSMFDRYSHIKNVVQYNVYII